MDSSGFLYYSPEMQGPRQKQHYIHHPNAYVAASPQLLAPTPIHFPSQLVLGGRGVPLTITPAASPSLMEPRVSCDMYTDSASSDFLANPATPPLTHSAVSTPSIPYAMPTPISNHGWSSEEPLIATVSLSDVQMPTTPADYFPAGLVAPAILKSNATPPPSISVSMEIHCPALSPCASQDSFSDSECCDPRELTVGSPAPVTVKTDLAFPAMPALSTDDDEFLFGHGCSVESFLPMSTAGKVTPYIPADFNEELSDLCDSEDDFIQNFTESVFSPNKRVKYEDDSENEQLPSPPLSASSSRQCSVAPAPKRRCHRPKKEEDTEDEEEMTEEQKLRSFKFGSASSECSDDSCDSPCSKPAGIPIPPSAARRGRKPSLTADPSKTFVCHLCDRRFRRQEHLKRHFRSLHTEDKPFSCNECGKRFSRSDNLTQHSRIHGTGAVVLGVLTEGEVPILGSQFSLEDHEIPAPVMEVESTLPIVVVEPAMSAEEKKARKKRKRSDE